MSPDPAHRAGERRPDGYRPAIHGGASLRADVIDVYIVRGSPPTSAEFLQLQRAKPPLQNTWHPLMAHCEPGESALACAIRELREEVGLDASGRRTSPDLLGLYALQGVHAYYLAALDAVVLAPRFVALVTPTWTPRLNHESAASRWVAAVDIDGRFLWPGQRAACREILDDVLPEGAPAREFLLIRAGG